MRLIGPLKVNPWLREVTLNGETLDLSITEYEILLILAAEPRRCFTKQELYTAIWGRDSAMWGRTLDTHVYRLRKKVNPDGRGMFVVNVWGVGYRLTDLHGPEGGWEDVLEAVVA